MTFGAPKQQQQQQRQLQQRTLAKLTMAIAGAGAATMLIALAGCDDPHRADRRVRDTITEARIERAKGTPEAIESAQSKLEKAAGEANAAAATQTNAKAMLAQAQYDAAVADISHPTNGVDATNRDIIRLIREINQLGQQINASNSLVRVYQQMEPKEARSAVQQRILEATGDASKTAWVGEGDAAVPTLTAVQQQVEQQQAAVDKQQELIKGLQAKQEQVGAQAAQASSQAEAAPGRAGFDLFKQGVGLRKQSADIANQVDVEQSKLAQLAHNLKLAQARQQAVATAIQQFQELGKNIEAGWKGIEAQTGEQKKLAGGIVQTSIAEKAKALDERIKANNSKYDSAQKNLNSAIENYQAAATAANKLRTELSSRENALPSGNQMKVALHTLGEVFHPGTFELGQATSQLALANLQVAQAQTLNERAHLIDALSKTLSEGGLSLPAQLNDPKVAESAKSTAAEASKNYTAAMELFSTASDGGGGDAVKKGAQSGKIYALYGQALLARANGADAKEQLAAAQSARDVVLSDSPGALSALPAELVPPPSTTQPAAHAATAPAGAATTPAEGAAPATTPAEGATQPAEGATPGTPATTPAEGAAPAPAATPPATETPAPAAAPAPAATPAPQ